MADFINRLMARLGMGGVVAIAVSILLLLPFNVIAATRLTGWSWWAALACVLVMVLIPLLGQIAYVGLAVVGAFYLGHDSLLSQPPAAAPPVVASVKSPAAVPNSPAPTAPVAVPQPTNKAPPAPADKFTEWKRTVAAPAIEANCVEQAGRRGLVEGRQIEQMARVCACYGAAAVNVVTEADVVDNVVKPTPSLNARLSDEARRLCQS